ncbi:MAG: 1-acyl-sn-glycerol-3-phosphate acyltransferase [Clostridia bacterium]|nr:1-acyl-sn-glycerol-3-phosphate acyltransferase [Clostridia bacterium]
MKNQKPKQYKKRPLHHVVYQVIARPIAKLLTRKYKYRTLNTPPREVFKQPFILVSNHTSHKDKNFMISSLPHQAYFVATEDIFCNGAISRIMRALFDPIPLFKPDMSTVPVRTMLRRLRGGDSIVMYPEGHHSPDGLTTDIKSSVGSLVKAARCQLITFRLVGGFFMAPRWCASFRTGPVRGEYVNVYSPEQLSDMSADEITELINRDLAVDAYEIQAAEGPHKYISDRRAETCEVHYYICPHCGAQSHIHSHGNTFHCAECGMLVSVDEYGYLHSENDKKPFPFKTFKEYNVWQRERENEYLATKNADDILYSDEGLTLLEYIIDEAKTVTVATGDVYATFDAFHMPAANIHLKWTDLPWLNYNQGGRGMQFIYEGHHYEVFHPTFCAVRYGNLFFRAKDKNGELNIRY